MVGVLESLFFCCWSQSDSRSNWWSWNDQNNFTTRDFFFGQFSFCFWWLVAIAPWYYFLMAFMSRHASRHHKKYHTHADKYKILSFLKSTIDIGARMGQILEEFRFSIYGFVPILSRRHFRYDFRYDCGVIVSNYCSRQRHFISIKFCSVIFL